MAMRPFVLPCSGWWTGQKDFSLGRGCDGTRVAGTEFYFPITRSSAVNLNP